MEGNMNYIVMDARYKEELFNDFYSKLNTEDYYHVTLTDMTLHSKPTASRDARPRANLSSYIPCRWRLL